MSARYVKYSCSKTPRSFPISGALSTCAGFSPTLCKALAISETEGTLTCLVALSVYPRIWLTSRTVAQNDLGCFKKWRSGLISCAQLVYKITKRDPQTATNNEQLRQVEAALTRLILTNIRLGLMQPLCKLALCKRFRSSKAAQNSSEHRCGMLPSFLVH